MADTADSSGLACLDFVWDKKPFFFQQIEQFSGIGRVNQGPDFINAAPAIGEQQKPALEQIQRPSGGI
jgi:hypothetical protein